MDKRLGVAVVRRLIYLCYRSQIRNWARNRKLLCHSDYCSRYLLSSMSLHRHLYTSPPLNVRENLKVRKVTVINLRNPLEWLKSKWHVYVLQSSLDPEFDLEEFVSGSKHASSKVSNIIASGDLDELDGIVTQEGQSRICNSLENYEPSLRKELAFTVDDIQLTRVKEISVDRTGGQLDIDMYVLAVRFFKEDNKVFRVITDLFIRFNRIFKKSNLPTPWIISDIEILRHGIMPA